MRQISAIKLEKNYLINKSYIIWSKIHILPSYPFASTVPIADHRCLFSFFFPKIKKKTHDSFVANLKSSQFPAATSHPTALTACRLIKNKNATMDVILCSVFFCSAAAVVAVSTYRPCF